MVDGKARDFGNKIGDHGFSFSPVRDHDDVSEEEFYDEIYPDIDTFFVIAGFPKCATTTIASILDHQQSVTLPELKEPFFFSSDEYDYGMGFYWEKYFGNYDDESIVGEGSTPSSYIPFVPRRLAECLPDAKIIFSLRNPVDRAYSNWWMYRNSGLEDLSFEEAVDWELRELEKDLVPLDAEEDDYWHWYRRRQVTNDRFIRRRTIRTYVLRGYYALHIRRFLRHFPRDQILCVYQEDLKEDREGVMTEILDFLDVPTEDRDIPPQNYHRSGKKSPLRLHVRSRLAPYKDVIPASIWSAGRTGINAVSEAFDESGMSDSVRERLVSHYRPHNEELQQLVDRDLSHWNQ